MSIPQFNPIWILVGLQVACSLAAMIYFTVNRKSHPVLYFAPLPAWILFSILNPFIALILFYFIDYFSRQSK
jgi:hypothetical protein